MNHFLIFHSSSHTSQKRVRRYRKVAKRCSQDLQKQVRIMAIDVEGNHPKKKHKQTNRLIETTTVVDEDVVDHAVNPSDSRVCEMIEDLP